MSTRNSYKTQIPGPSADGRTSKPLHLLASLLRPRAEARLCRRGPLARAWGLFVDWPAWLPAGLARGTGRNHRAGWEPQGRVGAAAGSPLSWRSGPLLPGWGCSPRTPALPGRHLSKEGLNSAREGIPSGLPLTLPPPPGPSWSDVRLPGPGMPLRLTWSLAYRPGMSPTHPQKCGL